MKKDCIVGIDISSTNTGLCVIDLDGNYLFAHLIKAKDKDFDNRVLQIYTELFKILDDMRNKVKMIGIESISFGSKGRVVNLAMQNGFYYYTLLQQGYNVIKFTPSTIKKFATGNGRASKEDMINNTPKEILEDFKLISPKKLDDLVDSYAIAKLTLHNYRNIS
jgi:Holliday junction resolvasome RuvABC endonuclease subunit